MNQKDKEAYDTWLISLGLNKLERYSFVSPQSAWKAACEYKDAQYHPRYEESEDAVYINGKKFYSEKVVKELEDKAWMYNQLNK